MKELEIFSQEAVDNCSLVYLIDENLCLSNSYDIINTNFDAISSAQDNLTKYANIWYGLYTNFSANSANWLNALYNITTLSAQWESAYATKEAYKKYWDAPIYLVYPEFLNFTSYYAAIATYNALLNTWVNTNFPPESYIMNQVIDLTINLYIVKNFAYNFHREYNEICTPSSGNSSATLCCNGCGGGSAGLCNHYEHFGGNKHHGQVISCYPVCQSCSVSIDTHCASYTCHTTSPPKLLTLDYNAAFSDRYINRIISLKFQNNKVGWIQL